MFSVPQHRSFRLRAGGVECGAGGLHVDGFALLARDRGAPSIWRALPQQEIERALTLAYGMEVDASVKLRGIEVVAASLSSGELARAQIAALFLHLPDPALFKSKATNPVDKALWLLELGLLAKEWNEESHPRTGTPPNRGWFASQPGGSDDWAGAQDKTKTGSGEEPKSRTGDTEESQGNSEQQVAVLTRNFRYACRVLSLDIDAASEILHQLKHAAGLGGADNCTFETETGDVYFNGEHIGNLVE